MIGSEQIISALFGYGSFNENYGELKRFISIINSFPLQYEQLLPLEKKLSIENNPPEFQVKFFREQTNLKNINCYSNEIDVWERSNTTLNNNTLIIKFRGPFVPRRGRINCSLNDNGKWRWFEQFLSVTLAQLVKDL